jgi:FkbM family methyltransferase
LAGKILLSIYKLMRKIFGGKGLSKYSTVRSIKNYANSNLRTDIVTIQGHKIHLDPHDSMKLSINEIYEALEIELIKKEICLNDFVIDVGAHIGYHTLNMAKCVGENGKVFSFEPEPDNFCMLKKNVEVNHYSNVITENKAVGITNGKSILYTSQTHSGIHRMYPSKSCQKQIEINSVKLDDYFKKNNLLDKIKLIKIDVEGAELNVLQGSKEILSKSKNLLIFLEFIPNHIMDCGMIPKDILDFLQSYGFKIFCINEHKNKIEPVFNEKEIFDLFPHGINLFCKK